MSGISRLVISHSLGSERFETPALVGSGSDPI